MKANVQPDNFERERETTYCRLDIFFSLMRQMATEFSNTTDAVQVNVTLP